MKYFDPSSRVREKKNRNLDYVQCIEFYEYIILMICKQLNLCTYGLCSFSNKYFMVHILCIWVHFENLFEFEQNPASEHYTLPSAKYLHY